MSMQESLEKRRSVYQLDKELPVPAAEVTSLVERLTELVPDAFNMKSQRVVVALGAKQDELWDAIYDVFGGKVAREKIDMFKNAVGTVLFFIDDATVTSMQEQFPRYAENFGPWSEQSNGMLQIAVWSGLRDLGIGANIQHYNPVIDEKVHELFGLPESWRLRAQMDFGGIVAEPDPKEAQDIAQRVKVFE